MDAAAPSFHALVNKAVKIVGSQPLLALAIGKSQQHVSLLCTKATFISAEDSLAIHRATGGEVPASSLRPDLWSHPDHVPLAPCGGPDGGASQSATVEAPPSFSAVERETGATA